VGKQWAATLLVGALIAAACGTSSSKSGSEPARRPGVVLTTPTTRQAPATTSSTVPAYSFDDSVPPPRLINTGTDYVAILKSIESYGNWLAAHHPDPSLVHNIIARGTREFELFSRDLVRLRDNHRRATETLGGASTYTVVSVDRDAFSARAVEDVKFHRAVDPDGRVTSEVRYAKPTTYLIVAVRARGHWYFVSQDEQ
jgi:hypothetical protein